MLNPGRPVPSRDELTGTQRIKPNHVLELDIYFIVPDTHK